MDFDRLSTMDLFALIEVPDPTTLIGRRDRLILCLLGVEGMEPAQIVAVGIRDIFETEEHDGIWTGQRHVGLGQRAVQAMGHWLEASGIEDGPIVVAIQYGRPLRRALSPRGLRRRVMIYADLLGIGALFRAIALHELPDSEIELLLRVVDPSTLVGLRDRAMLSLMAYHAAPIRAVIELDVDDLDLVRGQVRLWSGGGTMSPGTLQALATWIGAARITEGSVFVTMVGKVATSESMSDSAIRSRVRLHLAAAGIHHRIHLPYM